MKSGLVLGAGNRIFDQVVINCTNRLNDAKLEATKDNILWNDTALLRTSADILYKTGDYARRYIVNVSRKP